MTLSRHCTAAARAAAGGFACFFILYHTYNYRGNYRSKYYTDYYCSNHFNHPVLLYFKSCAFLVRSYKQVDKRYYNKYCDNRTYAEAHTRKQSAYLVNAECNYVGE